MVRGLNLKEGSTLIAITWLSKAARHYHRLCPQMFGGNTKKRNNAEKRLLIRLTGIDTDIFNLSSVQGFIQSES